MIKSDLKKAWRAIAVWTLILVFVRIALIAAHVLLNFASFYYWVPQMRPLPQYAVTTYLIAYVFPFLINIIAGYFVSFYSRVKNIFPSLLLGCSYFIITFTFSLTVSLIFFFAPIEFIYGKNAHSLLSDNPKLVQRIDIAKSAYLTMTLSRIPSELFYSVIPILLGGYLFLLRDGNSKKLKG